MMKKDGFEILKKFGLWFITIFFLEFAFILVMHTKIEFRNICNILINSFLFGSFFAIITNIFKEKVNTVITAIILFVLGFLFSTQCVFYSIFKIYFSFSNLGLGDQVTSYLDKALSAILSNFFNIIVFMLPFILFLIFKKKIAFVKNNKISYVVLFLLFTVFSFFAYFNVESSKGEINGVYDLYHNVNEVNLNIPKLGVLNSYTLDLYRVFFGFVPKKIDYIDPDRMDKKEEEEEIEVEPEIVYEPNLLNLNLDKPTDSSSIQKINTYVANDSGTMKNEYTGIFKGYNLIYITAESFSEIGVSEELTPTLYKLTHSGFIFDNYYTPNALSTIGGEFQSLTGLYPDSAILKKWRDGNNYFPFGLATIFRNLGYNTYAYHNNSYAFQDRHKYLVSQGFTNYLGCWNGMEKRINCRIWPASDDEMMEKTIPDYIYSEAPFLAYYMTVSGHFAYTNDDNMMSYKHRNEVANMNATSAAKAYVATQIELDRALERLINELTNAGKLDNTVIVLLADHYPYELDLASINSLSTYEREETVTVNHNNLIIWNSKLEDLHVEKPCMSSDVIPTVFNLFGVDYDSRLFTGRDIFSDSFGIAIMRNHSWITDKGIYYANGGNFVGNLEELPEGYIDNINTLVNNRLNIAKLIVETNYYNYLFS